MPKEILETLLENYKETKVNRRNCIEILEELVKFSNNFTAISKLWENFEEFSLNKRRENIRKLVSYLQHLKKFLSTDTNNLN